LFVTNHVISLAVPARGAIYWHHGPISSTTNASDFDQKANQRARTTVIYFVRRLIHFYWRWPARWWPSFWWWPSSYVRRYSCEARSRGSGTLGETQGNYNSSCSSSQEIEPSPGINRCRSEETLGVDESPLGCPPESWRRIGGNKGSAKEEARSYRGWTAEAFRIDESTLGGAEKSGRKEVRL